MIGKDYYTGYHVSTIKPGGVFAHGTNVAINAITTLYTVAVGYELLLTQVAMTAKTTVPGIAVMMIYNNVPALRNYVNSFTLLANDSAHFIENLIPPLVLPANWSVRIGSDNVNLTVIGALMGYRYPVA